MFNNRPCSWVRDTTAVNAQAKLNADHRDVIILDAQNQRLTAYNLTTFPLENAANRAALKNLLIDAATPADTDDDKLPDYWEQETFGALTHSATSLLPDGKTTLLHFMLGKNHLTPTNVPQVSLVKDHSGHTRMLYQFTRRRGLLYGNLLTPQVSLNLNSWSAPTTGWSLRRTTRLYNGTASEMVEWWTDPLPNPGAARFICVKAH